MTAIAITLDRQARVKSTGRVRDIIELLARQLEGLGFTELLTRSDRLGLRVWEGGQAYLRQRDLVREALPVIESVARTINETTQLAILDGIENVYMAKVESSHPLRLQSDVGRRLYAHATGLGKTLLAHLCHDDLLARLKGCTLPRFTENTINDESQIISELATIHERGFAVDADEYTPGVTCLAVPICSYPERAIAALSVSIPVTRVSSELLSAALQLIAEGGLNTSRRLGCSQDDPRLARLLEAPVAGEELVLLVKKDARK